ncbi:MAG: MBL fold metallo-hydrolase [Chloroflexota bacterium]
MKLQNNLYVYPESGMLDCNTYVITGAPGIIIDPGSPQNIDVLLKDMRRDGIDPGNIGTVVNTHLHLDHSWGNTAFKEATGARIMLHPRQQEYYPVTVDQTARFFGLEPPSFTGDGCLEDSVINSGDMEIRLLPSPGHSPDSICYYCPGERFLICGDVLFARNTGRVDLPGGNADQLRKSIGELARLDIASLLPGHMSPVRGEKDVKENFTYIRENVLRWL